MAFPYSLKLYLYFRIGEIHSIFPREAFLEASFSVCEDTFSLSANRFHCCIGGGNKGSCIWLVRPFGFSIFFITIFFAILFSNPFICEVFSEDEGYKTMKKPSNHRNNG